MKILSKFKQLKKDIKLIIITVLIMSCIGVYATGTCIVAATADDVTYNNTTVSAALNDLYELTQNYCPPGYECRQLKYVTDCSNNKIYTTTPNNLSGLAKIMAESAYLDNGKSEFVSSCEGVKFNAMSSNTNGKGVYELASTKNDTYPIYYYRGVVDNNNVKFGGFCWKVIRTTDSGGVKMIYNGTPDESGNCTNTTGANTQIGTSAFNTNADSPGDVGYMYGTRYSFSSEYSSNLTTPYVFGNDVTYSNGTYTLIDTMTSTGTWSSDYKTLNNNHYTCFSSGTTCTSVYYIYYTSSSRAFYMELTSGKKVEDALDDMLNRSDVNTNNSTIKNQIDNWYNANLSSYTNYIEDSIYCNDRSISNLLGWNPNGGNLYGNSTSLDYGAKERMTSIYTPTVQCINPLDKYTISTTKGNGALTYPVGLITVDEVVYAGSRINAGNSSYLYTNQNYWTMSPSHYFNYIDSDNAYEYIVYFNGGMIVTESVYNSIGVRPVISLKSTDVVESGDGTQNKPYVIKTS